MMVDGAAICWRCRLTLEFEPEHGDAMACLRALGERYQLLLDLVDVIARGIANERAFDGLIDLRTAGGFVGDY